jgi:hypothetical protein
MRKTRSANLTGSEAGVQSSDTRHPYSALPVLPYVSRPWLRRGEFLWLVMVMKLMQRTASKYPSTQRFAWDRYFALHSLSKNQCSQELKSALEHSGTTLPGTCFLPRHLACKLHAFTLLLWSRQFHRYMANMEYTDAGLHTPIVWLASCVENTPLYYI